MDDIEARNGMVMVNEVLGIPLRKETSEGMGNARPSLLQRLFGFREEDDVEEEGCAKKYLCWTCGAAYETGNEREFLRHIKECCRD